MQSSSHSQSLSIQVPIKVQHKIAKKRSRRRRIDLDCGCSYFLSINCHNHGFTHRGNHHCNSSGEWRFYLGGSKSPIFQNHQPPRQANVPTTRHHHHPDTIQPQPTESTGTSQMLPILSDLHTFESTDWEIFKSL
uniref:Transcriptional activator protein n=1 Tax=Clerodendron golden mosaic virus TaxID=390438 RepID=F2X1R2_9GEMI|nr:TrAP protein [Clerodendron golden mosaic virus]UOQ23435.1 transactivator protein [Clerodendron golden mosaic virus]UOQ23441.1 transactivator protein [Clerodendron golden mosaic virus]